MTQLTLTYDDEGGTERQFRAERFPVIIGRHSSCDLCIPDPRLSREHVLIAERNGTLVVSDKDSSNGTELNGVELTSEEALRSGDTLNLGAGVRVQVSVETKVDKAVPPSPKPAASFKAESTAATVASQPRSGGIPIAVIIAVPLFAFVLVVFAVGLAYIYTSGGPANSQIVEQNDDPFEDETPNKKGGDPDIKPSSSASQTPGNSGNTSGTTTTSNSNTPPANLGETAKVEQHAAAFLRRIAQNDPKAFLTSEQAKRVSAKIKQVSSNAALSANLASARKSSSQIAALAGSKNLKPQFLAVAAITKLGNTRGDVLQTAQGMADVLDKLGNQIGSELADDAVLMIAAYDQGAAGDFLKMRNMLQDIATKFPDSSRAIRTIWFLEQNKRLSPAEFDRALTFIAIGTIADAPKDFGVSAEPLAL